ncbi:GDSL-type esterase/lipase family protein [Allosalinactinospora lopnorensis]|uniref:GDSL-type esterase/lipase family protein n=1 Tax=Allosalinactinospora lopnorensis TaxID=1352348 RepID=UPI000698359D|nr:GDSL-type esterase/lipase family protein [Allosalinactinospora lopnorensis]
MNTSWRAAIATVAATLLVSSCSAEEEDQAGTGERYYLSLGDSLSVGLQPDDDGKLRETSDGYTDALYRRLFDRDSTLDHKRLGCGGEDTTTFLSGGREGCDYDEGSQLAAAENFLERHGGQVALVTLDIGGNNFTGCAYDQDGDVDADLDTECVQEGLDRMEEEIPQIAARLREAAGADVQIVGMTYYNPFVAALLLDNVNAEVTDDEDDDNRNEPSNEELAEYSTDALLEMNDVLRSVYEEAGVEVADVEQTFNADEFDVPPDSDTDMPANVQSVCDYTWMCNTDRGPDIHTNQAGANEIAKTFDEVVEIR